MLFRVQATAAVVAIALTVTIPPAQAMPWPCWIVRNYVKKYTPAQLEKMARERGITISERDRADVRACIRDRK